MPEFIARPNLPNALSQSLVQMAAHINDPIADAIKSLGALVNDVTEHKVKERSTAESEGRKFKHETGLKQMDIDARNKDRGHDLLMKLIESGQATPAANKPLSAADAAHLIDPNFSGPLESSGKRQPPKEGSYASEDYPGGRLPAGYDINPKDEKKNAAMLSLNKDMKAKAPSLSALPDGSSISNKDYLDAVELEKSKGGAAADRDMALAEKIVSGAKGGAEMDPDQKTKATLAIEAKIKAHRRGEKVNFDEIKSIEEPEGKSLWQSIQEGFSSAMATAKEVGKTLTPKDKPARKPGAPLPGLKITKKA